jgi:hypothetical protein
MNLNEMISLKQNERLGRMIADTKSGAAVAILKGNRDPSHVKTVKMFIEKSVDEWLKENYPSPQKEGYENAIRFFTGRAKDWIIGRWSGSQ